MDATLLPKWAANLPGSVLSCIAFFVGMHIIALVGLAMYYQRSPDTPDFKSKLK
jgi:hypothetical protein